MILFNDFFKQNIGFIKKAFVCFTLIVCTLFFSGEAYSKDTNSVDITNGLSDTNKHSKHITRKHDACIKPFVNILKKGDFSGPLECKYGATFKKINLINFENYSVYNYIYRFKPEGSNVVHGGQKAIFISSRNEYIGQFNFSVPPMIKFRPKHNKIILIAGNNEMGEILLTNPPRCTWQDSSQLYK